MNKVILLNQRPHGKPSLDDFKFIQEEIPTLKTDEVLLKTIYVSVDPYLRSRMNDARSYIEAFKLQEPIRSAIIAEVVESNITNLQKGDFVSGNLSWKEYQNADGKRLQKIDKNETELTSYLGVLGTTGLTAYLGLTEIGMPKAGETLVVSGAAGAVGTMVGQIGKLLGCKVIGLTGSDEKVTMLKTTFNFDHAINYKTVPDLKAAIRHACPDGVDIYFDNVGGIISDAVMVNINQYARIVVCGAISLYNATELPVGPRIQPLLITKSATMRGFIILDFADQFPMAIDQLAKWLKDGKLTSVETIVEGFDNIPQAFLDLFVGKNKGKMIVKV